MPYVRTTDGIRIHYSTTGRGGAPPVVMIQGLGADKNLWILQRLALAGRYRTIALDNRGAGRSDKPYGVYSLMQMVDDTIAVMDYAGAEDAHVVGASMVAAAALPHLKATNGTAAFLTSVSASLTPPWPGLASYAVTKAALDKLVDAWRAEHPSVGFTRVVVGECAGGTGDAMTEFANGWDGALAGEFMPGWFQKGYMSGTLMPVERLVNVVRVLLQAGATDAIPQIVVAPRPPA